VVAARFGWEDIVAELLANGANPNVEAGYYKGALLAAIRKGNPKIVELLLDHGADPNPSSSSSSQNPWGDSLLNAAAFSGNDKVMRILLNKCADSFTANDYGNALTHAVYWGHLIIFKLLQDRTAVTYQNLLMSDTLLESLQVGREQAVAYLLDQMDVTDFQGNPTQAHKLLMTAIQLGNSEIVKILLAKGTNPLWKSDTTDTALHLAAFRGHHEIVRMLLNSEGTNIESRSRYGETALQISAGRGHEQVVRLLLEEGADANATAYEGRTALEAAAVGDHLATFNLLLEKEASLGSMKWLKQALATLGGAAGYKPMIDRLVELGLSISYRDGDGNSVLSLIVISVSNYNPYNRTEFLRAVLDKKPDLEARNYRGRTALHHAVGDSQLGVSTLLLDAGANIEARTAHGSTPLTLASECVEAGAVDCAVLVLDTGADIRAVDGDGDDSLLCAACAGNRAIIQLLLDKGASLSVKNHAGHTPAEYAAVKGHEDVAEWLRSLTVQSEPKD
jgi:ankyrin repeat protein